MRGAKRQRANLAALIGAVLIPLCAGGLGLRWGQQPLPDPSALMSPYRSLIARIDQTMVALQDQRELQSVSPDWAALLPEPPAPESSVESSVAGPNPAPAVPLFDLLLRGILWKEGEPYAVVNERVVTVDETINGFRVAGIERNRVTFVGPEGTVYISDIDQDLQNHYPEFFR